MKIFEYLPQIFKALLPFKEWFYKQIAGVSFTEPAHNG